MYIRKSTRTWMVTLIMLTVMSAVGSAIYLLPAGSSSAVGGVNVALPDTTEVVINGTAVAQFPPPPDVTPGAQDDTASSSGIITATTVVTYETDALSRQPLDTPSSVGLTDEIGLSKAERDLLDPRASEWRLYEPGEQAEVGITPEMRELAREFLQEVNAVRSQRGLPALVWDDDLAARAEGHAQTMLYYWVQGNGPTVVAAHREAIDAFYGLGDTPRYPRVGFDSVGAPTALLQDANRAAIKSMLVPDGGTASPYGAAALPVQRIGIGIAVPTTGKAPLPQGWITMAFQ